MIYFLFAIRYGSCIGIQMDFFYDFQIHTCIPVSGAFSCQVTAEPTLTSEKLLVCRAHRNLVQKKKKRFPSESKKLPGIKKVRINRKSRSNFRARAKLEWDLRLILTFLITFSIRRGASSNRNVSPRASPYRETGLFRLAGKARAFPVWRGPGRQIGTSSSSSV